MGRGGDRFESFRLEQAESERGLRKAAQEAIGPWLSGLVKPDLFVTGTYDRRKICRECRARPNPDGCPHGTTVSLWKGKRDAARFFWDASRALRRPVEGVAAMEGHQLDNSAHLHAMLAISGGQRHGDVRTLSGVWRRHGYSRIEVVRSPDDVCGYCGKYVTKAGGDLVFSSGLDPDLKLVGRFGR